MIFYFTKMSQYTYTFSLTERIWRISKLIPEQTKVKHLNFGTYITTLKLIILRPRTHEPPPFCETTTESQHPELEFLNSRSPKNRFQGINTASLYSLAGRYDNPVPILGS